MADKSRLLVLSFLGDPTLPPGIPYTGGMNQTVNQHIQHIARLQLPCTIITNTSRYADISYERISPSIELYRLPFSLEETANQDILYHAAEKIFRQMEDIILKDLHGFGLIHSFYWYSGYIACKIKEKYAIPMIHTVISSAWEKILAGVKPNSQFQLLCERQTFSAADYILAITLQEDKLLRRRYGIKRKKIIVVGRSVAHVFHDPVRDENGNPSNLLINERQINDSPVPSEAQWWNDGAFLYLGRIVAIKGIDHIIRAWCTLREQYPDNIPPLWIVGGSPQNISDMRTQIKNEVPQIELYERNKQIIWWGYLDAPSISALLLKTLVLVTHSRFEAGGRVIIEAMCQGNPVISTPNGFGADYIIEWYNGFKVPYGDVNRLAECMGYFVRNSLLSNVMGNAAKEYFEQIECNWNYFGIHTQLYEKYLQDSPLRLTRTGNPLPNKLAYRSSYERLTIFPYGTPQYTSEQWEKVIGQVIPDTSISVTSIYSADGGANLARIHTERDTYIAKQFYSRLNRDMLWNRLSDRQGFHSRKLLQRALHSASHNGIVPVEYFSELGAYYFMKRCEPITICDGEAILPFIEVLPKQAQHLYASLDETVMDLMDITLPALRQLDLQYRVFAQTESFYPITLPFALSAAEYHSKYLRDEGFDGMNSKSKKIRGLLRQTQTDAVFGVNYGKSLVGHVVMYEGIPRLLPSANWYWGEIGPDIVLTLLQLYPCSGIIGLPQASPRLLLWQLYLVWQEIYRAKFEGRRLPKDKLRLLHETLSNL